jgi:putative membrane protein
MHGYWYGYGGFLWIVWLAVAVVIIWAAVRFLTGASRESSKGADSAEDVLKKRYARGEISKEEYEQILRDLRK